MQWQWKQEDFAENIRFMSGRERRLAERQMGVRLRCMASRGNKIDKQKARQKELWMLEDERFSLQRTQYEEQKAAQQEQLNMSKQFFKENQQATRRTD